MCTLTLSVVLSAPQEGEGGEEQVNNNYNNTEMGESKKDRTPF